MRTPLPEQISTIDEAKAFLKALYDNGESFHPEDDPHDIGHQDAAGQWIDLFTREEADQVENLMDQAWKTMQGTDEDPCGYILSLDPAYKMEE